MNELLNCCLYFTASKLDRIITKMADEEFSIIGLSPTYAFLMMVVQKEPGISPSEISKELNVKPSTTTRFIDKLVMKGLVKRESKGKFSSIYLTPKGENMQGDINKAWENLYHRYSKILGYEAAQEMTSKINHFADQLIEGKEK